MSTKHLRRMLEEQEKDKPPPEIDSDDDVVVRRPAPKFNAFALLEDDDGEKSGKDSDREEGTTAAAGGAKKKKNNKKKNKKKKGGNKKDEEEDKDDDALLDELAKQREEGIDGADGDDVCETVCVEELFKVDRKLFDPSEELKKALGRVLNEGGGSSTSTGHTVHKAGWGRIVKARRNWPPLRSIGLSMEVDPEHAESNGVKWFKFAHNTNYEKCERMCWMAEDSHNHELINEVLSNSFYHLNSLLLISNVYRMQDDITQSSDFIERGIFYCEHSFNSLFQVFSWQHRLDYAVYENRAFYLLLHRHMLNILHKRCFKTALNVAKLVFSMDPQGDPMGILLLIDTIALKAKEYGWLLKMYQALNAWKKLNLLPNFLYSIALAQLMEGKEEEADRLLSEAIVAYPGVVTEILNELQIQADGEVENNAYLKNCAFEREPAGLKLLVKVYVKQSAELWKVPSTLSWLERVTRDTVRRTTKELAGKMDEWKLKRERIFVGSPPNLRRLATLLSLHHEADGGSVTDPVPPTKGRARYTRDPVVEQHADGLLSGLLHSLYPDFDSTEHLTDAVRRILADFLPLGGANRDGQAPPPPPGDGGQPPRQE